MAQSPVLNGSAITANRRDLTRFEFWLLSFVILSFSYEIPLVYITSMYKANPYLLDISSVSLVLYWILMGRGRGWRWSLSNPLAPPWVALMGVFAFAVIVSAVWLPLDKFKFSLWYYGQYVRGLLIVLIVWSVPLTAKNKRSLLWVALFGGAWCGFFGLLQFFDIVGTARVIPKGDEIQIAQGTILSTLGTTYFHAGYYSVITTVIGFAVYQSSRGSARILAMILTGVCAIPAVVAGTRGAFLALVVAVGATVVLHQDYRRKIGAWVGGALIVVMLNLLYVNSLTQYRTSEKHSEGQYQAEAQHRISKVWPQIFDEMKEHPIMVAAGGGFYVVPVGNRWRIGYGIHNMYLFPFEQAGILALGLSIWMWWRLGTRLGRRRRDPNESEIDRHMRQAFFGYFLALLVAGWAGGSFWMSAGTEHLNTYIVLMFGMALKVTGGSDTKPESGEKGIVNYEILTPYLDAET